MPCEFEQTLFLGASVRGLSCNVGFDQQQSQLTVNLVEDEKAGDPENPKVSYNCGFREETILPDRFYPQDYSDKLIGTPCFFKFGELEFGGIIQNWERNNSIEGKPTYSVVVVDPREILAGVTVITGGYSGTTQGVSNILNVFAHMEGYGEDCDHTASGGFGGALANEGGMPWNKIKQGIEELTAPGFAGSDFGGLISFRDHIYSIDIGELPILDDNIRISGNQHNLLDLIDYVCSSTNHSYFIELVFDDPNGDCQNVTKYIKVNVVPRGVAPLLGRIQQFIDSETAAGRTVISNVSGYELRIEPTTSFLVGGNQVEMFDVTQNTMFNNEPIESNEGYKYNIWPYWGDKVDSDPELPVPILSIGGGTTGREKGLKDNQKIYVDITNLHVGLEAFAGADGKILYELPVGEMRHILVSFDAWLLYMSMNKPSYIVALETGSLAGIKKFQGLLGVATGKEPVIGFSELVNTIYTELEKRSNAKGLAGDNQRALYKSEILYGYLLGYIQEYYGKKFMISLPEICSYREAETNKVVNNVEPDSAGWYEFGENLLGALSDDLILFRADDGRLRGFVRYTINRDVPFDPDSANEFFLDTEEAIIYKTQNAGGQVTTSVFVPCEIDPQIRFIFPQNIGTTLPAFPKAIITVNAKVTQTLGTTNYMAAITDALGKARADEEDLGEAFDYDEDNPTYQAILEIIKEDLDKILKNINPGDFEIGKADAAIMPNAVALPIKDLVNTYGPWVSTAGPPGPVNFEKNEDLVPWNYGSEDNMDTVANAIVSGGLSNTQILESGTISFAAAPQINLGRTLLEFGPVVTGIDVAVGTDGVQTTYRMKTYTNRYGVLAKANADRFRRLSDANNRIIRNFNAKIKEVQGPSRLRGFGKARKANASELTFGVPELKRAAGRGSKSPIPMLYAAADSYDEKTSGGGWFLTTPASEGTYVRNTVYASNYSEFVSTLTDDNWKHKAFLSLDGMFVPFRFGNISSVQSENTMLVAGKMPSTYANTYETGNEFTLGTVPPTPPTATNFSEFLRVIDGVVMSPISQFPDGQWLTIDGNVTAHNIAIISRGATPPSDISTRFGGTGDATRSIAIRCPLMLAGWGFDIWNRPVPNYSEDAQGRAKSLYFKSGFLEKPHLWKAGPVDLRWDHRRGMWVAPTGYKKMIVTIEGLPAGKSRVSGAQASAVPQGGNFDPDVEYDANGSAVSTADRKIFVYNPFGFFIANGDNVLVEFDPTHDLDTAIRYVIVQGSMVHYEGVP